MCDFVTIVSFVKYIPTNSKGGAMGSIQTGQKVQYVLLKLTCGNLSVKIYTYQPNKVKGKGTEFCLKSILKTAYEPRQDKKCLQEFPTRSDTNQPAQPQKLASVLKFWL